MTTEQQLIIRLQQAVSELLTAGVKEHAGFLSAVGRVYADQLDLLRASALTIADRYDHDDRGGSLVALTARADELLERAIASGDPQATSSAAVMAAGCAIALTWLAVKEPLGGGPEAR